MIQRVAHISLQWFITEQVEEDENKDAICSQTKKERQQELKKQQSRSEEWICCFYIPKTDFDSISNKPVDHPLKYRIFEFFLLILSVDYPR